MSLSTEECNDAIQPLISFTKLPEVFSLHLQIVTEKRAEYEASLKVMSTKHCNRHIKLFLLNTYTKFL